MMNITKEEKMVANVKCGKSPMYDWQSNTLVVPESFYKKAQIYGSPEFYTMKNMIAENEGCKVAVQPSTKKTYKGLTLPLIREYIEIKDERETLKAEMNAVKEKALEGKENITEKMADKLAYPLIKKWFLKKFADFSVSRAQKEISDYKIKCAEASVSPKKGEISQMPQKQMANASGM
ncbi:MAG: hypothetical protein IJA67_13685 [Oscillospiraceae bacterium]|nr:hypothetical protein [Oscillospiraceae bacterium]